MHELLITLVNKPEHASVLSYNKRFMQIGGSIGRGEECDYTLPDETKTISKIHALIHYRDEQYYITDISTNGVFVNSDTTPLGKGNNHAIFDNDQFQIGDYTLRANFIDAGKSTPVVSSFSNKKTIDLDEDFENLFLQNDDISNLLIEAPQQRNFDALSEDKSIDDILQNISEDESFIDIDSLQSSEDEIQSLLANAETVDDFIDIPEEPVVPVEQYTIEAYEEFCREQLKLIDDFYNKENLAAFFAYIQNR